VSEIFFAGEKAQERPALQRIVVANGATQHRIMILEGVKHRALRDWACNFECYFAADVRQVS
jgi:hypothetical protein